MRVTKIREIPFTQAITFVQFLPIIKEKALGLLIRPEAIAKAHVHHSRFPYLHCSERLEQGLPGLLWACVFRKKARGEVARAQSALKGALERDQAGADAGESARRFTSDPRQRAEILTTYHSREKQSQW